ncbi:MAG: dynamin family protein [Anaerolineae bacterium]
MLHSILNEQQAALLKEEKHILEELRVTLAGFEVAPEDMDTLGQSLLQLDELFLLVVVGEFNAGKSAFINALLGQRLLVEGVTPTTTQINIIKYGPASHREMKEEFLIVQTCAVDFLREINIVDTPGTNTIIRRHEEITQDFIPRSDLVIFVTSADRPFTESERIFLERIRQWGKKVVIVLNKIDIIEDGAQVAQAINFIVENSQRLLGFAPEIFPISAKLALQAKMSKDGDEREKLWAKSRFGELERYILETLDEESRIRLKLLNPLGIAGRMLEKYLGEVQKRFSFLEGDFTTIENIERQLAIYKEDMQREFRYRLSDVDNILYEMESRGMKFFDEHVRLGRIFDLINTERIRGGFEREVVADTSHRIETSVNELIDWLVESDLRQWQAIMEYLDERRVAEEHKGKFIGELSKTFEYNRRALLDSVGRVARQVVDSYDKESEAKEVAEGVRMAVAGTALLEVGAVGLGTLLVILLHGLVVDFSGILAASVVAILGFLVIPSKRRQAKEELGRKISDLRRRLMESLTTQFDRELERSLRRINEAISPYTRFVRAERDKLERTKQKLQEISGTLNVLKKKVEEL